MNAASVLDNNYNNKVHATAATTKADPVLDHNI